MLGKLLLVVMGLGSGMVVGASLAAFINVLGVPAKAADAISKKGYPVLYSVSIVLGAVAFSALFLFNFELNFSHYALIPMGILFGMSVGVLAFALAEMLEVMPGLFKFLSVTQIKVILWVMMIGKVVFTALDMVFGMLKGVS